MRERRLYGLHAAHAETHVETHVEALGGTHDAASTAYADRYGNGAYTMCVATDNGQTVCGGSYGQVENDHNDAPSNGTKTTVV